MTTFVCSLCGKSSLDLEFYYDVKKQAFLCDPCSKDEDFQYFDCIICQKSQPHIITVIDLQTTQSTCRVCKHINDPSAVNPNY